MSADHEAYVWFHLTKTNPKDHEDELRTVIWNKNKDTMKHPKQHLMFVPQTCDFYRVEFDAQNNMTALDKNYRRPAPQIVYEEKKYVQQPEEESFSAPSFLFTGEDE